MAILGMVLGCTLLDLFGMGLGREFHGTMGPSPLQPLLFLLIPPFYQGTTMKMSLLVKDLENFKNVYVEHTQEFSSCDLVQTILQLLSPTLKFRRVTLARRGYTISLK